jgi:isoamylase
MVSQGVPMILMGDEIARTQYGNNNAYCHDSDLSWMDWSLLEKNAELFRFAKNVVAFRRAHPAFRNRWYFNNRDQNHGYPDISFHGTHAWDADWSDSSRVIAFMLSGQHGRSAEGMDDFIYVAMNMHWEGHWFELPRLPDGMAWHVVANTGIAAPEDVWEPGREFALENQSGFLVGDHSIVILVGK